MNFSVVSQGCNKLLASSRALVLVRFAAEDNHVLL
jgi:hypothetical protein